MTMDLAGTLAVSIKVLSDWRVLFIAVAVILLWATLRYVGSVYRNRSPRRKGPRIVPSPKMASSRSGRSQTAQRPAPEEDADGGMIE